MSRDSTVDRSLARFEKLFPKGSIVFHDGDEGKEMFVLREGRVRVSKIVREKEQVLAVLERGDFFGEMAILNNRPRSATVTCLEECRILVLDPKTFESFLRSDIEVALRLIRKLSQRLQAADDLIENLLLGDDDSIVVNTIKKAMAESSIITGDGIELAISARELATRTGLELDRVKEIFGKLRKLEVIAVKGKTILIPSKQRLMRYMKLLEVQSDFFRRQAQPVD